MVGCMTSEFPEKEKRLRQKADEIKPPIIVGKV